MDSLIDLTVKELIILDASLTSQMTITDKSDDDQQKEQEQAVSYAPDSESEDENAGELMNFVYI